MSLNDTAARLLLAVGPEHDVVILQTHHAAFDGISSLALLSAICAAYRDAVGAGLGPQAASPHISRLWPRSSRRARTSPGLGRRRQPSAAATGTASRCCPAW